LISRRGERLRCGVGVCAGACGAGRAGVSLLRRVSESVDTSTTLGFGLGLCGVCCSFCLSTDPLLSHSLADGVALRGAFFARPPLAGLCVR
jgi:hypothetical protein